MSVDIAAYYKKYIIGLKWDQEGGGKRRVGWGVM